MKQIFPAVSENAEPQIIIGSSVPRKTKRKIRVMLDLGCGRNKYPGAIGIDVFAYEGVDVVCDAFDYISSLPPEAVDMVVMRQFIEHVDPARLISLIYQVLKPKGKILIETPNALSIFRILRASMRKESVPSADHILVYTCPELRNLLHRNGFKNIEISYFNGCEKRFTKRVVNRIVQVVFPLFSSQLRCMGIKSDFPFSLFMPVKHSR